MQKLLVWESAQNGGSFFKIPDRIDDVWRSTCTGAFQRWDSPIPQDMGAMIGGGTQNREI